MAFLWRQRLYTNYSPLLNSFIYWYRVEKLSWRMWRLWSAANLNPCYIIYPTITKSNNPRSWTQLNSSINLVCFSQNFSFYQCGGCIDLYSVLKDLFGHPQHLKFWNPALTLSTPLFQQINHFPGHPGQPWSKLASYCGKG